MIDTSKIKTEWDLTLLYKSADDPQIQIDTDLFINSCNEFARKYEKDKSYMKDSEKLLQALGDYKQLLVNLKSAKPLIYFYLITNIDSKDEVAAARLTQLTEQLTKSENSIKFFAINLGKITKAIKTKILSDPKFAEYKYLLIRKFLNSKYDLSLAEEKIISLMSIPAHDMWTKAVEKSKSKLKVKHNEEEIPVSKALNILSELSTPERRILGDKINQSLKTLAEFSEAEINAIYTEKKILDELRKLKKPYSARIISAENDEKTVLNLVKVVTKNFKFVHKFYKLKAKLLNEKRLKYADRSAKVGTFNKSFTFDECYKFTYESFKELGQEFADYLQELCLNGEVDVYPREGKRSGAFCLSEYSFLTYILLNHTDDFRSASTLAHEVGHAIHAKLSKENQNILYWDHSLSTAEVASTFFEIPAFEKVTNDLPEELKIIALHDRIQDDISTIFRQIAFFNFELELHNSIREKGQLTHLEIAKLMNKHMQSYLGPMFDFDDDDGYFFITVGHIRWFFYVYTYAFGSLVSRALSNMVKKDPKSIEKVKQFLKAGCSDTPENIFAKIGIDVKDPKFFEGGLKEIENDINELERLMKAKKLM